MKDIRQKLIGVFQTEAKDHLVRIRATLGKEGTSIAGANLDDVFRRAHSLKGAARAVDLRTVESLAHPLETLFSRVRDGDLTLDSGAINAIQLVLDAIEEGVAGLVAGKPMPEPERALQAIAQTLAGKTDGVEAAPPPVGSDQAPPAHGVGGATSAADYGAVASSPPLLKPPEPLAPRPGNGGSTKPAVAAEPFAASKPRAISSHDGFETIRVSTSVVDRLHRSAGEMTTETLRQDLVTKQLKSVGSQINLMAGEWQLLENSLSASAKAADPAPALARISRVVEVTARRLRTLSKETRALEGLQQRSAWALRNLSGQLQQDVCSARMVAAENVFDGFGKMMRDLARDEGKEIDFRVTGLEVEADRLVLQALKDPLMHLLRNSLGHGLESPAERRKAGKPPAGLVSLHLESRGNCLLVIVEDDGRGVDLNRVTEVAVEKGLIPAAEAAALSPEEQIRLIFHPGFSTARIVTSLSGRGMGLNIVADAAARMQGTVEVEPRGGAGTRFTVSVPIAVAKNRLLLLKCSGQIFAIAAHEVERLYRIKPRDVITIEGRLALSIHRKVPLATMAQLLKLEGSALFADGESAPVPAIVLKSGEKRAAVAVDELLSEIEGVIEPLSPMVMRAGMLSGGVLLGDGSVVFVLNASELIEALQSLENMPVLKAGKVASEKQAPVILLVDDSITTRTLEKSILEAHGYQVVLAVDGIEALAQLRSRKVDLVVSDVEMPRLDGFGLLAEIKKDPKLSTLPVIIVTSLEKREDKERGLALGASGYIVKRKFDQKELLETVRQMV